jgi:FKBP-type peptidyl-prolyl cis-trans isomerase
MSEVKLKYKVGLLDGSYGYSSDSSGVMDIKLGQSDEPTGLQEGILKLNEGGKALLIVPSYLAYGITGDGNKITGAQPLVYNIELIEVKNEK